MHSLPRPIASLFLASVFVISASNLGCAARVRLYDQDHADWHRWNGDEDHAYRSYLSENHKDYREFSQLNRDEQAQYWNWRHSHPDDR